MGSANVADLDKVWEIKVLKKERAEEARKMLEAVAKQVQPIMRKRKWKVRMLSEFSPTNPALLGLNVNRGQEVKIRLRPHKRDSEFYPWEHVLGTMLHELTHNEVGPHNANFYKLLDEITKECEDLMAKGISGSGQGFDARGVRLGGVTHNPPPTNLRSVAARAAEKRLKATQVMPSGPRKLGGDRGLMRDLPPGVAAAMAAERRAADDKWCAGAATAQNESDEAGVRATQEAERGGGSAGETSGSGGGDAQQRRGVMSAVNGNVNGASGASTSGSGRVGLGGLERGNGLGGARQASRPGEMARKDVGIDGKTERVGAVQRAGKEVENGGGGVAEALAAAAERRKRKQAGEDWEAGRGWACSVCTLENNSLALQCGACGALRSAAASSPTLDTFWHCQACTLQNPAGATTCSACGAQRDVVGGTEEDADTVMLPADGLDGPASTSRKGKESVTDGGSVQMDQGRVVQGVIDLEGAGPGSQQQKGWACKFCTLMNEPRSSKCAACEEWRYSFGAPLTHRPVTET